MEVVLYFQSQSKTNAGEKLGGVQAVAALCGWLVQVVEGLPPPRRLAALMDFWRPVGAIVEAGGTSVTVEPAVFGALPVVFFDHDPSSLPQNAFCVTHDSVATAQMAARELMLGGARAFAFVPYPERRFWSDERERGFLSALALNGRACRVFPGRPSAADPTRYQRKLRAFLAELPKPCALFAALSLLSHWIPGAGDGLVAALSWAALAAVALSIPVLLRRDRGVARAAVAGLCAAGLFGLVMSFGPDIRIASNHTTAPNVLFAFLHSLVPGLAGFRVVSRFAVFPLMAVCAAAAFGTEWAARALRDRPRSLRLLALPAFLALFLAECLRPGTLRTRPVRDTSASAVLAALDAREEPFVLAVVPMGNRELDSEHMLAVERHDRLGIWAWGGTYPQWTRKVHGALRPHDGIAPDQAAALLRQPWPETLVLEDRRPFPGILPDDYAAWFGPLAETIAEDSDFRLLRILPAQEDQPEAVRLVRRDFALARPVARFALSARDAPARVWLDLNGVPVGVWDVEAPVQAAIAVPPELLVEHLPQRFRFHAEGDRPFRLADFRLEAGGIPAVSGLPSHVPDLPWLSAHPALPPRAVPLDIRYPGGMVLCGAMRRPCTDEEVAESGILPLRLFLRFPAGTRSAPGLLVSPGFARRGSVLFQHATPLRAAVTDATAFGFAQGRIVTVDVNLPLPGLLRPGETYDLTLDVKTPSGHRLSGHDADGRKIRHAPLGLRWRAR